MNIRSAVISCQDGTDRRMSSPVRKLCEKQIQSKIGDSLFGRRELEKLKAWKENENGDRKSNRKEFTTRN